MLEPPESMPEAQLISAAIPEPAAPAGGNEKPVGRPTLWHHTDYMKVWLASTISLAGSQVSQFAIPVIAALGLGSTAFEVALLGTFGMLPFILFTLPAGA